MAARKWVTVAQGMRWCLHCGEDVWAGATECPRCGQPVGDAVDPLTLPTRALRDGEFVTVGGVR